MDKIKVFNALENLEKKYSNPNGYSTTQILNELKIEVNENNGKAVRAILRSMMLKKLYPEFKTAGNDDIVYPPQGKGKGLYRLSKYRNK